MMVRYSSPRPGAKTTTKLRDILACTFAVVLLIYFLFLEDTSKTTIIQENTQTQQQQEQELKTSSAIKQGSLNGIASYQTCQDAPNASYHIVLLHGSRFTKEDWKTSGILQDFCDRYNIAVTALDVSVRANYQELLGALQAMPTKNTPVSALVTPSASGKLVLDWFQHGSHDSIDNYVERWIPVGCTGVLDYKADFLIKHIFSIHGALDAPGKKSSERLQELAAAQVQEIPNATHPCYLDAPRLFVDMVVQYVKSTTATRS